MLQNDLLLRAAKGEKVERPPVWMMRQAGRILPEYRAVRAKAGSFKNMVVNPEMVTEVTLQPVDILGVDAAILFSDILVIPEAMGCIYQMSEGKGPWFEHPVQNLADIERLKIAEASDLQYVMDSIALIKKELNNRVPLIGFAGAPWTILSYMIEGSGSKTFSKARKFLYTEPILAHRLLEKITLSTIHYLKGQIQQGVDLIQLFDSWAGILEPNQYHEFSLRYIQQICEAIPEIPKTVFAKGAFFALESMADVPCQVLGIDWNTPPAMAIQLTKGKKVLQGNLDPCLLYADEDKIQRATIEMMNAFKGTGYIANLGHGVYPDTDPMKVKIFIDTVKAYSY
jgi:uroporphyrinogen decarboxylase